MSRDLPPLFVDLDRTLIRTDTLEESLRLVVLRKPWALPKALWLVLSGRRLELKHWLSRIVTIRPADLPYSTEVRELIDKRMAAGGKVFLATASPESIATPVARHLGTFDGVLASGDRNLKGAEKLAAIRERCEREGEAAFDYAGDSRTDLPIFSEARKAYLVSSDRRVAADLKRTHTGVEIIPARDRKMTDYLDQLRIHQWVKNLLLFLPLILAHRWMDADLALQVAAGFLSFSLVASGIYVLNDFVDLESDRANPYKRLRPLASGRIALREVPLLLLATLVPGLISGYVLSGPAFTGLLLIYLVSNFVYSKWLKKAPVLDVVFLTLMYVLRIFAGGIITGLEVSDWLLTFSLFFFLSIAFGKRFTELESAPAAEGRNPASARGYRTADIPLVLAAGLGSAMVSVLVLGLYIRSEEVTRLYENPRILWLLCPVILYGLGRFWLLANRGEMHEDPVVFALKDKTSYLLLVMAGILLAFAHF